MTYFQQAIQLAEKEGYKANVKCDQFDMYESSESYCEYAVLLDPDFWKCLGKALGWKSSSHWILISKAWFETCILGKDQELFFKKLIGKE